MALVFAAASIVTAVLSLDATVVLLTQPCSSPSHAPATGQTTGLRVHSLGELGLAPAARFEPHEPVGVPRQRLSFAHFGATMALPWLAAIAVEWVVLRRFFATDLIGRSETEATTPLPVPVFACTVVALTLVGFFVASILHVNPAFAALGGAVVLAVPALVRRRATVHEIGVALMSRSSPSC